MNNKQYYAVVTANMQLCYKIPNTTVAQVYLLSVVTYWSMRC